MIIDLARIEPYLQVVLVVLGAFLAASVISIVVWTARDIRSRSRDIFVQLLSMLLVLAFNLPGLLLYFILRPRETLADSYERLLEEETLLQELEGRQACPYCHLRVEDDFLFCPGCHAQLRKTCANCGRLMHLRWQLCPYCGHEEGEAEPEAQAVFPAMGPEREAPFPDGIEEVTAEAPVESVPAWLGDQPSTLADEETLAAHELQGWPVEEAGTPATGVPFAVSDQPSSPGDEEAVIGHELPDKEVEASVAGAPAALSNQTIADEEAVAARELQDLAEDGEMTVEDAPAAVGDHTDAFADEEITAAHKFQSSPTESDVSMSSEIIEPPPFEAIK